MFLDKGLKLLSLTCRAGFTILEVMTSIFIVALLAAILSVVFNMGLQAYRQADEIVEIANKAQRFLGQISGELTGAMVATTPCAIPFQGTSTSVYFMAPAQNTSNEELCEIGYRLSGTRLMKHFITYDPNIASSNFEYPGSSVDYSNEPENPFIDLGNRGTVAFLYDNLGTWDSTIRLPRLVEIAVTIVDSRNITYTFTTRIFIPGSTNNL